MPILKSRHDHIKVYRPAGTRYADGRGDTITDAVSEAIRLYAEEFGVQPVQQSVVIEICGGTFTWTARFMEILEPEDAT